MKMTVTLHLTIGEVSTATPLPDSRVAIDAVIDALVAIFPGSEVLSLDHPTEDELRAFTRDLRPRVVFSIT